METSVNENREIPDIASNNEDGRQQDEMAPGPELLNHGEMDAQHENVEEVKGILELIAATGQYWHAWEKLKSLLSFQLKQVLSEYPEAKMSDDQQISALGEIFPALLKRLDEELCSFIDGPPFTLQRLCEILLNAQSIYPKLSKLTLALEKNLLVTSTLPISTNPYTPQMIPRPDEQKPDEQKPDEQKSDEQKLDEQKQEEPKPDELKKESEGPQLPDSVISVLPNGVEPVVGDGDEVMAEVDEGDLNDDMSMDMETFEEIVGTSEKESTSPSNS